MVSRGRGDTAPVILIDPPTWPAHGRLWSHLASDVSLAELHAVAAAVGVPERAFETDHYDVPIERDDTLVAAGAVPVAGRELLAGLVRAGIRRPRRKGEQVIASRHVTDYLPGAGPCRVDTLSSPLPVPAGAVLAGWTVRADAGRVFLVEGSDGWRLPAGRGDGRPVGCVRVRLLSDPEPGYRGPRPWIFRSATVPDRPPGQGRWFPVDELTTHPDDLDIWPLVQLLAR